MASFPYYMQLDQMDCGPTCIRMISKYYGKSYNLQSLREKASIGKEGATLLGLSQAAEAIGFRTMGAKISFDKLTKDVPLPCIVHWQQNHFVVIHDINIKRSGSWMVKFTGGFKSPTLNLNNLERSFNFVSKEEILIPPTTSSKIKEEIQGVVSIADPAKGLVNLSVDEFCEGWLSTRSDGQAEGVVLLLDPSPAFYEGEDEKDESYGFKKLLAYLLQYKKLLFQLILTLVVASGLQLLFPFLTQSVVDVGINTHNVPFIYLVLGAQIMLMAGRLTVDFIRSWILLHISTRINLNILSDFLIKFMKLPVSFFDTKQMGDLMQRLGDHHRIETFLTSQVISTVFSFLNLLIFGIVLGLYNRNIFLIFFGASLLYLGWVLLFLRERRKLDYRRFDVAAKSQSSLIQILQGMQEIRLAVAGRPMRWAWERLQAKLFKFQVKSLALTQYQQAGAFTLNEGKNILIIFVTANAVINGELTLGAMLAIQYIIGQLNSPIEQLFAFVQSFQDAKISLERLNEIHSLKDEQPFDQPSLSELPGNQGLYLKNLTFQYPDAGSEPVLENFNLVIPPGKTTAIVGMSGSGKTTLLKLLLKFYPLGKGEIRLGEVNLSNINHDVWRRQCGVVMQEGYIFSDSIARNIAVGVERIDATLLDNAVKSANLREFIDSLPLGYHTKIGAEGNGISQGQKQRILIARAVYKNPEFIFFDEATNALDANNELEIMKNLSDFFKGRTVVVVAHRLSTVRNAHQIVVLSKGTITELGSHEELIALKGDYWKLVKNQLDIEV